jgi:hypothetical protein
MISSSAIPSCEKAALVMPGKNGSWTGGRICIVSTGIHIRGAAHHIQIVGNRIHGIAMQHDL